MRKKNILSITEIEDRLKSIVKKGKKEDFITDFLSLYDIPKSSITRAMNGFNEDKSLKIKNKLYYKEINSDDVIKIADSIQNDFVDNNQKSQPRYIIVNNFIDIVTIDTVTEENFCIEFSNLPQKADFFLAWNGIEKHLYDLENPADRKAAERFAKLYDTILKENPNVDSHSLNLLLIRILFLLFAEDTNIIKKGYFTTTIKLRSKEDGTDLNNLINKIFRILNIDYKERSNDEKWLLEFPYVNGKLFGEKNDNFKFSQQSRNIIIDAGELLNWNDINPDILGSMIQSVASVEDRQVSGMHYTSVSNIMKVIKPLFLDDLQGKFENLYNEYKSNKDKLIKEKTKVYNNREIVKKLNLLLNRISNIKFFDPASGSGNFLIITYKEIRRLEIKILLLIQKINRNSDTLPLSLITLNNFNGIEIDDFAHEVAKISLWIAEHQMNEEMIKYLPGAIANLLPLKDSGNILCQDALKIEWDEIINHNKDDEIYIIGNPPYIGSSNQSPIQKQDLKNTIGQIVKRFGKVDYIAGWFYLGAKFIKENKNAKLAFITTNSIAQGNQVQIFHPILTYFNLEIGFAHKGFKWSNNAKNNAGVTISIVSYRNKSNDKKILFDSNDNEKVVNNISPYLTEGEDIVVKETHKSISGLPKMRDGNNDRSYGGLIFSYSEYNDFINKYPDYKKYFIEYIGGQELLNDIKRYALWINQKDYEELKKIPALNERFEKVTEGRSNSKDNALNKLADKPWRFRDTHSTSPCTIVAPFTSSENRKHLPIGIIDENVMPSSGCRAIYNAPLWLFGIMTSYMHTLWLKSVGGKLETRYRYSAGVVYNTFPIGKISTRRKNELTEKVEEILELREIDGGTLSELYNEQTMPENLRKKHQELDEIVDRIYQEKEFKSDEERLSKMLKLYEDLSND